MQRLNVAAAAGRWLANPADGRGGCGAGAYRLAADMLESLDQERLGGMAKGAIAAAAARDRRRPAARPGAERGDADGRHLPLLDGIIRWAQDPRGQRASDPRDGA
jgi:hypothetical protein